MWYPHNCRIPEHCVSKLFFLPPIRMSETPRFMKYVQNKKADVNNCCVWTCYFPQSPSPCHCPIPKKEMNCYPLLVTKANTGEGERPEGMPEKLRHTIASVFIYSPQGHSSYTHTQKFIHPPSIHPSTPGILA